VRRASSLRRLLWAAFFAALSLVAISLMMAILVPFVQWYVFSKQAPVCHQAYCQQPGVSCINFVNCFATEAATVFPPTLRWLYILIQGVILGLLVDVIFWEVYDALATFCTRKMNFRTLGDNQRMMVRSLQRLSQRALSTGSLSLSLSLPLSLSLSASLSLSLSLPLSLCVSLSLSNDLVPSLSFSTVVSLGILQRCVPPRRPSPCRRMELVARLRISLEGGQQPKEGDVEEEEDDDDEDDAALRSYKARCLAGRWQ
jgi:ABC-type multidrug transport system fused ATPase/permease subunit